MFIKISVFRPTSIFGFIRGWGSLHEKLKREKTDKNQPNRILQNLRNCALSFTLVPVLQWSRKQQLSQAQAKDITRIEFSAGQLSSRHILASLPSIYFVDLLSPVGCWPLSSFLIPAQTEEHKNTDIHRTYTCLCPQGIQRYKYIFLSAESWVLLVTGGWVGGPIPHSRPKQRETSSAANSCDSAQSSVFLLFQKLRFVQTFRCVPFGVFALQIMLVYK